MYPTRFIPGRLSGVEHRSRPGILLKGSISNNERVEV